MREISPLTGMAIEKLSHDLANQLAVIKMTLDATVWDNQAKVKKSVGLLNRGASRQITEICQLKALGMLLRPEASCLFPQDFENMSCLAGWVFDPKSPSVVIPGTAFVWEHLVLNPMLRLFKTEPEGTIGVDNHQLSLVSRIDVINKCKFEAWSSMTIEELFQGDETTPWGLFRLALAAYDWDFGLESSSKEGGIWVRWLQSAPSWKSHQICL